MSSDELTQRVQDCINNLAVLTPESKSGFVPIDNQGGYLMQKLTHVLEEHVLRGDGIPGDLANNHALPAPRGPRRGNCTNGIVSWHGVLPKLPSGSIVKYGKLKHLQAALDGDGIRVMPASSYGDASLGPHRYDNECGRPIYCRPDGGIVKLVGRHDGTKVDPPIEMPVIGNMTITNEMLVDYYVWCASSVLAPRLFVDFEADACLIIHDPDAFHKRVAWALGIELRGLRPPLKTLSVQTNPVCYYDPYDPPKDHKMISVPWHKPFQFLYQHEWRLIALLEPPTAGDLPVEWIKPGPLSDIAEIVYIGELEDRRFSDPSAIVPVKQ